MNIFFIISISLNLLGFIFMTKHIIYLCKCSTGTWEGVFYLLGIVFSRWQFSQGGWWCSDLSHPNDVFLGGRGAGGEVYSFYHLLRELKATNYKGESKCSSLWFYKLCFMGLKAVLLVAGHKWDTTAGQLVFTMLAYRSGPWLEFAVWGHRLPHHPNGLEWLTSTKLLVQSDLCWSLAFFLELWNPTMC